MPVRPSVCLSFFAQKIFVPWSCRVGSKGSYWASEIFRFCFPYTGWSKLSYNFMLVLLLCSTFLKHFLCLENYFKISFIKMSRHDNTKRILSYHELKGSLQVNESWKQEYPNDKQSTEATVLYNVKKFHQNGRINELARTKKWAFGSCQCQR